MSSLIKPYKTFIELVKVAQQALSQPAGYSPMSFNTNFFSKGAIIKINMSKYNSVITYYTKNCDNFHFSINNLSCKINKTHLFPKKKKKEKKNVGTAKVKNK